MTLFDHIVRRRRLRDVLSVLYYVVLTRSRPHWWTYR